jgi:hypothetical protein
MHTLQTSSGSNESPLPPLPRPPLSTLSPHPYAKSESARLYGRLDLLTGSSDGKARPTHPRPLRIHLARASSRLDASGSANARRAESSTSCGTTGPKKGVKGAPSRSVAPGSSPKTAEKRGDSRWVFGLRRHRSQVRILSRPLRSQRVSGLTTRHRRRDWYQLRSRITGKVGLGSGWSSAAGGSCPCGIFSSLDASRRAYKHVRLPTGPRQIRRFKSGPRNDATRTGCQKQLPQFLPHTPKQPETTRNTRKQVPPFYGDIA